MTPPTLICSPTTTRLCLCVWHCECERRQKLLNLHLPLLCVYVCVCLCLRFPSSVCPLVPFRSLFVRVFYVSHIRWFFVSTQSLA